MGKKPTSRKHTAATSSNKPESCHDEHIVAFDFSLLSDSASNNLHCISIVKDLPSSLSIPDKALVCTCIPVSPNDNLGSSQCVLYACTRNKLLQLEDFGRLPPKKSRNTGTFKIQDGSLGGKAGMFAEGEFEVGDVILLERPLMVVPIDGDLSGVPNCPEQIRIAVKLEKTPRCILEPTIKAAFARMTHKNKMVFLSLPNVKEGVAYETCNIWGTNLFNIPELDGLTSEEDKQIYSMVFNNASRINHSCQANCALVFDLQSFTLVVSATRYIDAGEEIVYDCLGDSFDLPLASQRQELLNPAGILCSCESCLPHAAQLSPSDFNRSSYRTRLYELNASYDKLIWNDLDSVTSHFLCYEKVLMDMYDEGHHSSETYATNFERYVQLGTTRRDLAEMAGIKIIDDKDIECFRKKVYNITWVVRMLYKAIYGVYSEKYYYIRECLPLM